MPQRKVYEVNPQPLLLSGFLERPQVVRRVTMDHVAVEERHCHNVRHARGCHGLKQIRISLCYVRSNARVVAARGFAGGRRV